MGAPRRADLNAPAVLERPFGREIGFWCAGQLAPAAMEPSINSPSEPAAKNVP